MEPYNNKFPVSGNNRQCIGPCYKKKHRIIHPVTLKNVTNIYHSFCPTYNWLDKKTNSYVSIDICSNPIEATNSIDDILTPNTGFNIPYFLKTYYNIYSFNTGVEWLESHQSTYYFTCMRVLDCLWSYYGPSQINVSDRFVRYYMFIIKKYWVDVLYNKFKKFIVVDSDVIRFVSTKQHDSIDPSLKISYINFIINYFVSHDIIYSALSNYINLNTPQWNTILYHNHTIQQYIINYFFKKIF